MSEKYPDDESQDPLLKGHDGSNCMEDKNIDTLGDLIAAFKSRRENGDVSNTREMQLKKIAEQCHFPRVGKLYYPACGADNSPGNAYSDWEIIYLDAIDTRVVITNPDKQTLIKGDLLHPPFDEKDIQFDVALLFSPGIHLAESFEPEYIEKTVSLLKEGGVLICDDYHGTARYIKKNMKDILEEVNIDEELKKNLAVFKKFSSS